MDDKTADMGRIAKVLVIGAKGMLGQELAKAFRKGKDYDVIAWDREEIDIADLVMVTEKITDMVPDIVINSAAYNNVDAAEENPEIAMQVNGRAPGYLAAAAERVGALMVHYSTDYVFKGTRRDGYAEHDDPDPQSSYAKSKLLGESEVQKNTDRHYIIRLSRLFGPPAKSEGAKRSFIDIMLDLAKTRGSLDLVDEEYGSPTYTPDLAKRTREILEAKMPYGIYHAANEGGCTWYGFAQEAFRIKGVEISVNPVSADKFPRPAKRPEFSLLLNTKLPPMRPWQEALEEYLQDKR